MSGKRAEIKQCWLWSRQGPCRERGKELLPQEHAPCCWYANGTACSCEAKAGVEELQGTPCKDKVVVGAAVGEVDWEGDGGERADEDCTDPTASCLYMTYTHGEVERSTSKPVAYSRLSDRDARLKTKDGTGQGEGSHRHEDAATSKACQLSRHEGRKRETEA